MKHIIVAAAVVAIASTAQAAYKNGSYTGVGQGREGPVTVQVDIAGGKIKSLKVIKHSDTPMLCETAEKRLNKKIVKQQGVEGVKAVSGATMSSKGILEAVDKALKQAR